MIQILYNYIVQECRHYVGHKELVRSAVSAKVKAIIAQHNIHPTYICYLLCCVV